MGSRHLSSYFPLYHFHFILLFHCPIVVYISTLFDRKVPILFFLDFLSGKSPLFSLVFDINIFGLPVSLSLARVISDEPLVPTNHLLPIRQCPYNRTR